MSRMYTFATKPVGVGVGVGVIVWQLYVFNALPKVSMGQKRVP